MLTFIIGLPFVAAVLLAFVPRNYRVVTRALALLATFTLVGPFRLAVWILLGGLAVKTWLVTLRRDEDQ